MKFLTRVDVDLLGSVVYILENPTPKQLDAFNEGISETDHYMEPLQSNASAVCGSINNAQIVCIIVGKKRNEVGFHGLLAHEISHAATFLLESMSSECDELRSTICQYITDMFYAKDKK